MEVTFQLAPDAAHPSPEGNGSAGALDRVLRLEALRLAMERRSANDAPMAICCVAREFYEFIREDPKARQVSRVNPQDKPARGGKA